MELSIIGLLKKKKRIGFVYNAPSSFSDEIIKIAGKNTIFISGTDAVNVRLCNRELLNKFDVVGRDNYPHEWMIHIRKIVEKKNRLLVITDAEYLCEGALKYLFEINEQVGIGILCYSSDKQFQQNVKESNFYKGTVFYECNYEK